MPRTYDSSGYKINSRRAEEVAEGQALQHQAALKENAAAGEVVRRQAAPVVDAATQAALGNANVTGIDTGGSRITQSAVDRLRGSGMNDAQVEQRLNGYTQQEAVRDAFSQVGTTGQFAGGTQALERRNDRLVDTSTLTRSTGEGRAPETEAEFEQRKAAIEEQNKSILEQQKIQQETAAAEADRNALATSASAEASGKSAQAPAPTPEKAAKSSVSASIRALGPDYALIADALDAQTAASGAQAGAASTNYGLETAQADKSNDAYGKVLDTMKADSKATYEEGKAFAEDMQQRREEEIARQKESTQQQLTFAEGKATREAKRALDKQLNQMITAQALSGGFGSSNWNAEVAQAENEGEMAIIDLQKEFGFKRADVDIAFTSQMNTIYETAMGAKLSALKDYRSELSQVSQMRFSATEKTEERKNTALQNLNTAIANIAKEQATQTTSATDKVLSLVETNRTQKRQDEQVGWNLLNAAYDNYKQNIPAGILQRVSELTGVSSDQLLRRAGSGGGGMGGASFTGSGAAALPDALYSNVNPQQLREAVDRITLSFGGTEKERTRKRGEYLDRINSGEPPSSIMESMRLDYWSSQKGAEKTRHDGRTDAQSAAESLQSFIEYYGISPEDDGPLGGIDSRVQSFASWFGQSSPEYNQLAAQTDIIRAKIVKDNYGSAVSPQELALAKSYIPEMTDKGARFITKAQNLKAYNAYLDAKQFAADTGLPLPKPPVPVSMSGDQVVGAGKYSTDDITSSY